MKRLRVVVMVTMIAASMVSACSSNPQAIKESGSLQILAAESFLQDIAQNVAGDRIQVDVLIPPGTDPHSFQATPQDVARIENADGFIINGGGLEEWLEPLIGGGFNTPIVVASDGLTPVFREHAESSQAGHSHKEGDPHFWLDPNLVMEYVINIQDALISLDPDGKTTYEQNAANYVAELETLNSWIIEQVSVIPVKERLLVTNHESLGYFADRYGFTIVGTIIPSVSSGATPSAAELVDLVETIKVYKVKAIFIETGANAVLAEQIANETDITVVSDIYTHSVSTMDGFAPTYINMMMHNTQRIVDTVKDQ